MQRGVHFDPLRLPLLGGCVRYTYGTVRRRRRRGCRRWCRSDLICPAGWLSARLDVRTYVRGTLGVVCLLRCCAALCCVLLLRCCVVSYGCVRVLTPSRESCCACGRPCCVRCCHTVVVVGWCGIEETSPLGTCLFILQVQPAPQCRQYTRHVPVVRLRYTHKSPTNQSKQAERWIALSG